MSNQSNTEFIQDFMTFSKNGAMSQIFVMEACSRYAKELDETSDEVVDDIESNRPFISIKGLQRTAREYIAKNKERHGN